MLYIYGPRFDKTGLNDITTLRNNIGFVPRRHKCATFIQFSRRLPSSSCFPLVLVQNMYYLSYWSSNIVQKVSKGKL